MSTVPRLRAGTAIESPVSGETYIVGDRLGEGGFGAAYRAQAGRRDLCLKITADSRSAP